MAGKATAVSSGDALCKTVVALGHSLGLVAREQFRCGRRIWGAERYIDVILTHVESRRRLGLECKFQGTSGSAEEKIPAIIQDIAAWPIPGLVVFSGAGFSSNIRSFLVASGRAVDLEDLEAWMRLFFSLDIAE
ncbi:MAG TPA: PD-(D/E)XK nuclease superfamily protein [Polyangiaceae bacterium]|jgi:hypothetical protein